jgi:hypothetical protein
MAQSWEAETCCCNLRFSCGLCTTCCCSYRRNTYSMSKNKLPVVVWTQDDSHFIYLYGPVEWCWRRQINTCVPLLTRETETLPTYIPRYNDFLNCGLSGCTIFFPPLFHKRHDLRKKLMNMKCVFRFFSTTFTWNTSHSKNNLARYCHKCENIFI